MRKTTLLCAAFFAASAAMADLYVDASASPGVADGTPERPYATIQAAVNAAESGTTIRVAEGTYSDGAVDTSAGSGGKSAVCITNKTLRLVGAGRGKSVIAGSRDPAAPNAYSDYAATSATRCIFVANADGTIIEGFTLRDGETLTTGTSANGKYAGGGLYADSTDVYLVDCDVVHCAGKYGSPIYKGTAVRCLFDDNYGTGGPGGRSCRLVNCVVSRSVAAGGSTATLYDSTLYNCTVVDNSSTWTLQQSSDSAYNSVLILSSNQLIYRETNKVDAVVKNCVLGSTAPKNNLQIMGPAVADWRLLPDSDAIGAGDPTYLSALDLPDGIDAFKDFTGAEIKVDGNGRINAGAVQTNGAPAAGALYFQDGAVEVNGRYSRSKANVTWVFPDVYPTQYCVKAVLNDGEELYRLLRYNPYTGANGDLEYPSTVPQLDGKMWLMPPVETELAVTNAISKAATVFWVDAARGSDEWGETVQDAGSTNHPFATIQRAVDTAASATRTVIKVMPGDYSSGVVTTNATCGKFRLHVDGKNMRIFAVEGPGSTFIRGAPDPDTGGLGVGAVKCAYLYGRNVYLQGFTLADGYSEGSDSTSELRNGAAVYSFNGSYRSTVMDCVITNCDSSGSAIMQAYLCRDRIIDCRSEDAVIVKTDGPLWGCYLRGNYVGLSGSGRAGLVSTDGARIYNSTFVGAVGEGRVCGGATISYNSIWDGGQYVYSTCVFTNSIVHNYRTTYVDTSTYSNADPLFVSRERDGVLRSDSPAVGMGGEVRADNFGTEYWRYAAGDVNGEPLVFTGGRPTIGAFQKTADFVQVTAATPANGGWVFADGAAFGTVVVPEGESLEIVPADGIRPCVGVSCGGVDYFFTNAPNETISLDFDTFVEAGTGVSITGIYSTDWYVDDDGDDGASGFLPTHPKKTLATAAALLAAGDTLWVFPGTYKEGSAFHTAKAIASRIVVKDGRSVISLEGAERTIIQGSAASEEYRTNEEGSGTNAVRCAYVGKGALLSGFTLTGGRTWTNNTAEAYADGSAVIGNARESGCVVANCIISNNIAYMGTIYKADVFHSLIIGNKAFYAGSAIRQANAYDCCISGNIGASVISYARDIWGCTVAGDNKTISGTTPTLLGNTVNDGAIFNSLFMGRLAISQSGEDYSAVSNCVFDIGSTFNDHVSTGNVFAVDRSTQSYDGGVVPVVGANVAVDAANESFCTNLYADTDLHGFQRVMNGRRDIGAYEADWRSRYAADLGRGVSVVEAAPFVEEVDGMVTIRYGAMSVVVSNASGKAVKYCLPVRVTGTGTLLVEAGEEPARSIEAGDGNVMLEFVCEGDSMPMVFAYLPGAEDEGRAILGRFVRAAGGFVLTVR